MGTPKNNSVIRAFEILNLISGDDRGFLPAEIANSMDMNLSTTHRFLLTLEEIGAVTRSAGNRYHLGLMVAELGRNVTRKDALAEAYKEGSRGEDAVADAKGHWELVNGEIRLTFKKEQKDNTFVRIYIINPDSSIREIGFLIDGKQSDTPKDKQPTYQKIL